MRCHVGGDEKNGRKIGGVEKNEKLTFRVIAFPSATKGYQNIVGKLAIIRSILRNLTLKGYCKKLTLLLECILISPTSNSC